MQPESATSFRLSPQQERLWSLQNEPSGRSVGVFSLQGRVDAERLRAALEQVVARHEILRTTFERRPGMRLPLQVVHAELAPDWQVVDDLAAAGAEGAWDLEVGPLVRARLVSEADDRHLLVLCVASVCADGASLATLARELVQAYANEALPVEPLQYPDFAEWQHELLAAEDDDAGAAARFWAEVGEASPPQLPFVGPATDRPRESVDVELTEDTIRAIEACAERYGLPVPDFVAAAWQVVLGRLAGVDQVLVAFLSGERQHGELETAIGAFARPTPLASTTGGASTFAEVAAATAHARAQAERWQDYAPLAAADALPAAFSSFPEHADLAAGGVMLSQRSLAADDAYAALELVWSPAGEAPLSLRFDPAAVAYSFAEQLAGYVSRFLIQAAAAPDSAVDDLELLGEDDVHRLTIEANATEAPRVDTTFTRLFAAAAARDGAHTAVADGNATLSYDELDRRANQLAQRLVRTGVGPDTVVGLCTDRSVDMAVGLLGVLKAGGAYLPLNFEHPPARLEHQLRESGAKALVTQEPALARLPAFEGETVCLDRDRPALDGESPEAPAIEVSSDNLAYVIYTSGSTGLPKGVAVTHGNLSNYVAAIASQLGADGEPLAFGMVTAISTDLGNTAVFPALATGGTLVLVPPVVAADGAALGAFFRSQPVDVLKITPSHLNAVLSGGDAEVLPRRWLVTGGEALGWDLVARVHELGDCRVLNHYGPTETTVGSCTFPAESGGADGSATVPIGRPIANTVCYVLDARGRPVPEGVTGELFIGGAGVARGYIGQPESTAERFRPDPFATGAGARMYATGDVARRLADGAIEFLGRSDDQLKIRGFRVEPAEVETALRRVSSVQDALVLAREDGHGDRRLVAYVVAPESVSVDDLRAGAAEWVPEFMIPSAFVRLDSFPRTPSGKVDRASLPAPDEAARGAYVAPRTPVEEAVAAIWASVLGLDRVSVEDDFFALGGHSLLATQIVAQIRSDFSIHLPLHALFTSPTVASLSEQIAELLGDATDADLLAELEALSEEEAERLLANDLAPEA